MLEDFKNRMLLPLESDGRPLEFMTENGSVIAKGYLRILVFQYGAYLEFSPEQYYGHELKIQEIEPEHTITFKFPDRSWVTINRTKEGNYRINALTLKSTVPIALTLGEYQNKDVGKLW
jgi:hypothetical protein